MAHGDPPMNTVLLPTVWPCLYDDFLNSVDISADFCTTLFRYCLLAYDSWLWWASPLIACIYEIFLRKSTQPLMTRSKRARGKGSDVFPE